MKLAHITINTENLHQSIRFYANTLDMKIAGDMRPNMPIVFLQNEFSDVQIELIENTSHPYSGSGLSIGFHVENAENKHKELADAGYSPTDFISPVPSVKFFFLTDPNGVQIQIM